MLPIDGILPDLRRVLSEGNACVLQAPPGAGKTTRVPPALLEEPWLTGKSILMLEPRRLAATNAARYMARMRHEDVGRTIGYAIRYEHVISNATRIEVMTEGILVRRLQNDPELSGVGLVIFDEFHERNLNSDLALALCREAQQGLREDLRILVMSATLDAAPVAELLGGAPVLTSRGREFPVEVHWADRDPEGPIAKWSAQAIRRALRETKGDILAFLPGVREILWCREILESEAGPENVHIRPLYGDLPFSEQEKAIRPGMHRRIVLATNIAETSLTIEGVGVVVDCGLERRPRFNPVRGMTLIETVRISRASADQRAGRAGRLGPGVCYRLWTEGVHGSLLPFSPPEIRTADLAPMALELARWGVEDAGQLIWLDPPSEGALAGARELLRRLGALDGKNHLTSLGEHMARYPAHPRIARMLVAAKKEGRLNLAGDLAALLSERDILAEETPRYGSRSDFLDRVEAIRSRRKGAAARAARYWREVVRAPEKEAVPDVPAVGRLLAMAFPDRIGREREPGSGRYILSSGQGARLSPRSAVSGEEWIVAVEVGWKPGGEGEIRLASALNQQDVEDLFGREISWRRVVEWDDRIGRPVARQVRRFGALVLQERPARISPEEMSAGLLEAVRGSGLKSLNWTPAARQLSARIRFLSQVFPETDWPDLSETMLLSSLEKWLEPFLSGAKSLPDLRKIDLVPPLLSLLEWSHRKDFDDLAPERLEVPSGSRIRLDYDTEGAPVLAVKLQELFGLENTPAVARGRVAVLIHLLSPAGRPVAVTRDLKSFWNEIYPEVKKELKGRYPRHPWPDDPWSAEATRRTKKKR